MPLDIHPLQFPWELFMQAQQAKNKNQQDMNANILGMGTSLGQLGQNVEQQKAKSTVAQAIEAMRTGKLPMQGPQLPGVGLTQGQPLPTSGMGSPTPPVQMPAGLEQALMTLDPKFGSNQFDELRQSEIYKNMAAGRKDLTKDTENMTDIYTGPNGEYSTTPKQGYVLKGKIPLKEAYQYGMAGQLADRKAGLKEGKNLVRDWRDIADQTNPFAVKGFGAGNSVFGRAAKANQAAARGLKTLNSKKLTWGELNGYVNSDLGSIFVGGGAPHDITLHQSQYNTLLGSIGTMKTYLTGQPASGIVPPETRQHFKELITDVIDTDNEIIDNQLGFVKEKYADRIQSDPERFQRLLDRANKIKTVGQDKSLQLGANPNGDIAGMSDDQLKALAAGVK